MAEDDSSKPSTAAIGLSVDDITPNVYEGGFKTWECSVDLASHLFSSLSDVCCADGKEWHIVEVTESCKLLLSILIVF